MSNLITSNSDDIQLDDISKGLLVGIMQQQVTSKKDSIALLNHFMEKGIITNTTTWDHVDKNHRLKEVMLMSLSVGLRDSVALSNFSTGRFSDFFLYTNCKTNEQLNTQLRIKGFSSLTTNDEVNLMKSNRKKLKEFVDNTLTLIINFWGLEKN